MNLGATGVNAPRRGSSRRRFLCDAAFLLLAACYALLALKGILAISANGALLDGDLQTYAQGMAGADHPGMFAADPILRNITAANNIPNLERWLATMLSPPDGYAVGLLRAGACAIFFFYGAWYIFGRFFFKSPALAAILSLLMGITVWTGWGTFWGVTHSDPVPRVFFAAIFPILLGIALCAINRLWLRPIAMLCAGLGMWVHGVNALNCGAMFFAAFALIRAPGASLRQHLFNCFLCLAAFFLPVLIFLWPSLSQKTSFTSADLEIFQQCFNIRWQKDYVNFSQRIFDFLNPRLPVFWILAGGATGAIITYRKGNGREKTLCLMYCAFILALVLVTAFCYAEPRIAFKAGRIPMGHELVRGLRFMVPLSWLMAVCAAGCLLGAKWRRVLLAALMAGILTFTVDRQYMAAQYALWEITGLRLPLVAKAEAEKKEAEKYRHIIEKAAGIIPAGEAVYSNGEDMALRYMALRPLIHTFKDGYAVFYNKDLEGVTNWLSYEMLGSRGKKGIIEAWLKSGAPWLLWHGERDKASLEKYGNIAMEEDGWLLVRKNTDVSTLMPQFRPHH